MKIEDGTGNGVFAKVNAQKQLDTFSIIEPEDRFLNKKGKTWSIESNTTPVGANDFIFYFKNTGTETYAVTDIRASCAGASTLTINAVSGTPTFAAGSDLTPVARNRGSSETITGTIKEDTNTTGLTDDGTLFFLECDTANRLEHIKTTSNIIIPPGQAFAMQTDGTTAVRVLWSFTVIDEDL